MKEYSDAEIIECLRTRQSYVVHWLSDRYIPMIKLMVYQLGGTAEDAKDIFQDGLIIMLEKIDNPDFVLTCKFKTYLYCVCENLWKTIIEKRRAAANYLTRRETAEGEKDFTEVLDNKLYEDILNDVIDTLDPLGRKILDLYWQDISPQEIADKLGYNYGYVRRKKCEAQKELTDKIKSHPGYRQIMIREAAARDVVY